MAAITLSGLTCRFGAVAAVDGVDLTIPERAFAVILGPSGCGKSTLLRMIAGLETPTAGQVAIGADDVTPLPPGRRGCAMVFQNYALYPHMTVAQNIGYALRVAGMPRAERADRVARVAATLGLGALLDRRPAQLSGGQRQRVAMGRAMVRAPRVFLFDEPLSNLDAQLRVQMRLELKRLHRDQGTTSVFVTHDQLEAMTMADLLVVMRGGRVEQAGTPAEVYHRPATRFVAGFVGTPAMNLIPARLDAAGRAVVAGGWSPCPALAWHGAPGTAVTLGVRPAAVAAQPARPGAPAFAADLIEDVGPERHLHARADWAGGRLDLTLARPAGVALPAGAFAAAIPAAEAHLFDDETGLRLAPRGGALAATPDTPTGKETAWAG
jgi:sn-glycerol 3-phosphate transport system ATP-binding protein